MKMSGSILNHKTAEYVVFKKKDSNLNNKESFFGYICFLLSLYLRNIKAELPDLVLAISQTSTGTHNSYYWAYMPRFVYCIHGMKYRKGKVLWG